MPELPEVETMVRKIRPHILNKEIVDLHVLEKGSKLIGELTPFELKNLLVGKKFSEISRIGKFMIFVLNDQSKVIAHLRMSGRFVITKNEPSTNIHNRLWLKFADSSYFNFIDIRRFATFHFVAKDTDYPGLLRLGPDAITSDITAEILYQRINKRKKSIYAVLLDQSIMAGVGNIYANEALYTSRIHPLTSAEKLELTQVAKLLDEVKAVLNNSITFKGTTLLDKSYAGGSFFSRLAVYGKAGKVCKICGSEIKRLKIGGRSVFVCENCQILI